MTLDRERKVILRRWLADEEFVTILSDIFTIEAERWQQIAVEAMNRDDDATAKRNAAYSAAAKSMLSRIESHAILEEQ